MQTAHFYMFLQRFLEKGNVAVDLGMPLRSYNQVTIVMSAVIEAEPAERSGSPIEACKSCGSRVVQEFFISLFFLC